MRHIERHIRPRVSEALDAFRTVVVHGARQSGKTTLAQEVVAERGGTYATLDDEQTRLAALEDPYTFLMEQRHPLAIDEIQLGGDQLVRAVKMAVDSDPARGRFLLTGSTDFLSVPTISESLAGRAAILRLWPLSEAEVEGASGRGFLDWFETGVEVGGSSSLSRSDYLAMVCRGGFPEAVGLAGAARRLWFESYVESVLSRDVAALVDVRSADSLRTLLRLAAARTATELNVADWCSQLGIDRSTLEAYLGWLRMVFLVHELPAWGRSLTARAIRRAKLLVADTGLAAVLCNLDAEALRPATATAGGALLETFAANELARQLSAGDVPIQLHHYRDRSDREIDLVMERADGAVVALEIKLTASPGPGHLKHLAWMRDRLDAASPGTFRSGVLLHTGDRSLRVGDRLYSAPLDALWRPRQP
ncbi:MAG: ATP-binding protein [Acidimicrobiaceae bacterium]|nr:ATP-binding protein [Acidimicrobiaceae bacterium]MYE96720.1 ATP-binding protein [Acidimicrobiaceae bacterium]MYH43792.1 ATP-binding protein [Acidimicrobiaceae bacterium]MYI55378.1 ATP-binding protein [Acidimicrobiaceae bacterium]MYJ82029.1 ATP-binding protein [Acidimicrobiaceae bacterium]